MKGYALHRQAGFLPQIAKTLALWRHPVEETEYGQLSLSVVGYSWILSRRHVILTRAHHLDDLPQYHDLSAGLTAGLEKDRIHVQSRFDAARLGLERRRVSHFATFGGDE